MAKKPTTAIVGTVDGKEWEVVVPTSWWPLYAPDFLFGRPYSDEFAEFTWRIRADKVVYHKELED